MISPLLERIKTAVLRVEPEAEIILFGSRARHDFVAGSDWDLLILVNGEVDYIRTDRIRHQLHEIEWDTGEVISSIVRSRQVWASPQYRVTPLYKNIAHEGVRI
jgi:predicted nucleotidyltransferase